jgi:signal transduction histidine kinase
MKTELPSYTRGYLAALGRHLKQASVRDLKPARKLGLRALGLGLETLDLARIHEEALIVLVLPHFSTRTSDEMIRRAGAFFAEALTPIEETHRGAQEANAHLNVMVAKLTQRTVELAGSNKKLKGEIAQRKTVEVSLRTSQQTSSKLLMKSRQMQEELRHLSRQLLSAQEEERRKISRELHDVIAQTLSGINVRLSALKSESMADTLQLQKQIADTQRLVEKSVDIIHRFARELRPTLLDDLGLIPALRSFMKTFMEDTGIRVTLKAFAGIEHSNTARRTVLYRVAQEALTNVARHAQASHAEVSIRDQKGVICMDVKDNGKGFKVDGTSKSKKHNRLGLLGMRERIEMVGGTFCVESAPGKHTTIRVEIPAQNGSAKNGANHKSGNATSLECA